jgi:selenide,water dikinase
VRDAARPKSGVFAVRAARPLFANLERHLAGEPLRRWHPQARFLGLIGTGDGRAVVSRGAWTAEGAWAWRWKDRIDRAFMRKFTDLPAMDQRLVRPSRPLARRAPSDLEQRASMRCLGCAGKVGGSVLHKVLARLRETHGPVVTIPPERDDIIAGLDAPDDAAVFRPPPGRSIVQTTDHLSALVADPFLFGRIAALHSMSDIVAMGAEPHSALVTALVPFAADTVTEELLGQLLAGVATELGRMGALLLGGHTAEAPAAALSLTCTGFAEPASLWRKNGLRPGDTLVLTKPLGTGTLFAAAMRQAAQGRWIDAAIASMLVPNQTAARLARTHGATAATDITGFGLLGHLVEMLRASGTMARLNLDAVPTLPGAAHCATQGLLSSLHADNARALAAIENPAAYSSHPHLPLLSDPQTSGGLLLAVPPGHAPALLDALHSADTPHAAIIGTVTEALSTGPCVVLVNRQTA